MAKKKSDDELKAEEALRMLKEQARLQQEVSNSYDAFIEGVKKYKAMQETINDNIALEKKLQENLNKNKSKMSAEEIKAEELKLKILKEQTDELKKQGQAMESALKSVNMKSLAGAKLLAKAGKGLFDAIAGLPNVVERAYGKLKGLGLFEMDKAMRKAALEMGVVGKETESFRNNIKTVAKETQMIGIGIEKLSEIQSAYSNNLGRAVVLSKEGLKGLGQMAAATGLGAEGAAQMASDMELQGISAEKTAKFTEQTMNDAHRMGLNASKVIKMVANNIKMLNKYNFKEGVKGLEKLAMLTTRLGVDMDFASGMADKLWDVEGAVEMSAQLQVMGGAWANMADPFHLMYMARNDIAGLTEELGNAAAKSVTFNNKTGEFDMAAKEMHRLKIIAEQTGIAYEDLVTAGKNAKKFSMIKSQIRFNVGGGEDGKALQDYLTNKALFQDGKAFIQIKGEKKLISSLTDADKKILQAQMEEQKTMKQRAEEAQTFDETLNNLINDLKISLLPFVEELADPKNGFVTAIRDFVANFNKPGGFGEKVQAFAKEVGQIVSAIGKWLVENPKLTAGIMAFSAAAPMITSAFSLLGGLWDTAKWFMNGVVLGKGFNSVASAGGGGGGVSDMLDGGGGGKSKGFSIGRTFKAIKGGFQKGGIKGAIKAGGKSLFRQGKGAIKSVGSMVKGGGKGALKFAGKALGAAGKFAKILAPLEVLKDQFDFFSSSSMRKTGAGGWLESLGGSGMSLLDGLGGEYNPIKWATNWSGLSIKNMQTDNVANARAVYRSRYKNAPTVIPNSVLVRDIKKHPDAYPDDVVEDAEDAQAVDDGIAKPGRGPFTITDKFGKMAKTNPRDGLFASPYAGQIGGGGGGTMRHEFGNINISGTIKVDMPGASSLTLELAKDETFRRHITRMVQEGAVKQLNQGKPKG
jgi:hypothetical protein